jgi:hypothetical protein
MPDPLATPPSPHPIPLAGSRPIGASDAPARPNLSRVIAALLLLATFAGCLWMYTRHNAFPYEYHPDEGGKALQILSVDGRRNFNHPQLMLEATQWATHWLATPADPQAVVVVGRTVSATFAALAVVSLALCGYLAGGLAGLIAVAPLVALSPYLLAYTHVMKEDATLVFGVAVSVLGARLLWNWGRRPVLQWVAVVVLAGGTAAAASAKYVGVVTVVLALLALVGAPNASRFTALLRPVVFLSYAMLLVLVINHRVLDNLDGFARGLEREIDHSLTEHSGLTMAKPNTYAADTTLEQTFPHARALLAVGLLLAIGWWRSRPRLGWDRCVWVFAALFLAVLSYSVIPMQRYALPVALMGALLAGVAAVRVGQFIGRPWARWGVPLATAAVTIGWQGPRCADYVAQFRDDSRQQLREFILNDPTMRGARVWSEGYVGLDYPPYHGGDDGLSAYVAEIHTPFSAGEAGSLESLRQRGYTHIAVADIAYARYLDRRVIPTPSFQYGYARRRRFYEQLFAEGTLIWSREARYPMQAYTNPTIRLYRL